MRASFLILTTVFLSSPVFADDQNGGTTKDLAKLFTKFGGVWACEGENSRGDKIGSMLDITTSENGSVLIYNHKNTIRNNNAMIATWTYDQNNKNLLIGRTYMSPNGNYFDVFTGQEWSENKLIFNAKELFTPLFAENRFIYEFSSDDSFKVTWEKQVGETHDWVMGDYHTCIRQ